MSAIFVPFAAVEYLRKDNNSSSFYFGPYAYEDIHDDDITIELPNSHLIDLNKSWEIEFKDDKYPRHDRRIAAIVKLILKGVKFKPVEMEFFPTVFEPNYLLDGHHRVRAYQYLKLKGFRTNMGGYCDQIKEFTKICKKYS